jgi:hypothetical protein
MSVDAPSGTDSLIQAVREKLAGAAAPLKLSEVARKPAKRKKSDFEAELSQVLADEIRAGRVFHYPSGPKGADRYWGTDERHLLKEEAVGLAAEPASFSSLRTGLKKVVKGTNDGFIDGLLRELVGEGRLFEYPAGKKGGTTKFGSQPPPPPVPPLRQAKFQKRLDGLRKTAEKLLADAKVSVDELLAELLTRLTKAPQGSGTEALPTRGPIDQAAELSELILKAVGHAGPGSVLSLAELRREMPAEYRGRAFDETVLRLADQEQVRVYQDSDPAALTDRERAEYVADGYGNVFKTIARRIDA